MNITIIIALLTSSLNFLTSSVGTPLQPVAMNLATQAVQITQEFLATSPNLTPLPAPQISATSTIIFVPTPVPQTNSPVGTQSSQTPKANMSIEIVNRQPGPGTKGNYVANDYSEYPDGSIKSGHAPTDADDFNIGAIVRDSNGTPLGTVKVIITATDNTQNKTLAGTPNVMNIYDGAGNKTVIPYYPFHYNFKTSGEHVITFSVEGQDPVSVTMQVAAN